MSKKLKTILGILAFGVVSLFGMIVFGLYLMDEEDRYGDLVYFYQKVEDGDIIFRCKYTGELGQTTDFNEYGIIEESWNKVYVWDNQNTVKKNLYDWAFKGNGGRVKVYRIKKSDFDIDKAELKSGTYSYLMDSGKLQFVTENY